MNVCIFVKADYVTQANAWLRNNLGATGDNITVPIILVSDPDDHAPRVYGCNWENFRLQDYELTRDILETVQNQIEANRVRIYKGIPFQDALIRLSVDVGFPFRVKPSEEI